MTPHEKHFWRWATAAMALTTIGVLLPYCLPYSYGIQPDWTTRIPGGAPFLISQAGFQPNPPAHPSTCSVSTVKPSTIVVFEGDLTATVGLTVNDSQLNSYNTPSTADGTFSHVHDGAFDFSYWVFLASSNTNGTDNISVNGLSGSNSAVYCAVVSSENTTGFYTALTQPVYVASGFNAFPAATLSPPYNAFLNFSTVKNDYQNGLAFLFGSAYISTQSPNFQIAPVSPFTEQCFVGAPANCAANSQNSGAVSFNFMTAHSVGGEAIDQTWSITQSACSAGACEIAGWSIVVSIPGVNSCLGCNKQPTGTPNTPQNLDIGTLINQTLPVWIYILIPSFLLGMAGAYFGMGIYGFVFGGIFGALTGVLANQLESYHLLVMLYGSVALLYATRNNSSGPMLSEVDDEGAETEDMA